MTVAQSINDPQRLASARIDSRRRLEVVALTAFAVVVAAFFLADIATLPMRIWDESRLAVNAAEMVISGQHLVTTYGFAPDLWNTKPPLLINIMAWSFQLFGFNTFALRLPSALAAVATVLITIGFVRRMTGSLGWALVAGVLLGASSGFYGEHAGQTGDYDALLTLLTTGYAMLLFALFDDTWFKAGRAWAVVGAGVLIGLAILTKGIAGIIPGVGCAVYAIIFVRSQLLRGWLDYAIVIVIAVLIGGGFYLARSLGDPAYLAAVAANDLGGRFSTVLEKHRASRLYYFKVLMLTMGSGRWPSFASAGAVVLGAAAPWLAQGRVRRAAIFAICQVGAILLVYSVAATKLFWYTMPAYPWLAILLALTGAAVYDRQLRRGRPATSLLILTAAGLAIAAGQAAVERYVRPFQPYLAPRAFEKLFAAAVELKAWPLAVVDLGYPNDANYPMYTPTLRFYSLAASRDGHLAYQTAQVPASGHAIGSCDPAGIAAVAALAPPRWTGSGCVLVIR